MNRNEFKKQLGLQLKIKRIEKYLSQEELAAQSNCSTPFISDVECGKKGLSLYYFLKIARVLDLNINNFLEKFLDLE